MVFDDKHDGGGEREDDVSVGRDESLSRNPIRHRMVMDRLSMAPDDLTEIVARGRDFFHSYIGQTIRRRYKRPPIYLVDGWVTDALGYFTTQRERFAGTKSFSYVHDLFSALGDLVALLDGARVLDLGRTGESLRADCVRLLEEPAHFERIDKGLGWIEDTFREVRRTLESSVELSSLVSGAYFERLTNASGRLRRAAHAYLRFGPPEIAGVSFGRARNGGVLMQGIPELDIEGPAVVIAPTNIKRWSESMTSEHWVQFQGKREPFQTWLGARHMEHVPFAVAMANVVQHEMTHAMLRLANDPNDEEFVLADRQDQLYAAAPMIEEGMANFVAGLMTANTLLKVRYAIRGSQMPVLTSPKYGPAFDQVRPLIGWTYEGYHREATDAYFKAWQNNGRNFKAFAGMAALFATDTAANDWKRTFDALSGGTIATSRS